MKTTGPTPSHNEIKFNYLVPYQSKEENHEKFNFIEELYKATESIHLKEDTFYQDKADNLYSFSASQLSNQRFSPPQEIPLKISAETLISRDNKTKKETASKATASHKEKQIGMREKEKFLTKPQILQSSSQATISQKNIASQTKALKSNFTSQEDLPPPLETNYLPQEKLSEYILQDFKYSNQTEVKEKALEQSSLEKKITPQGKNTSSSGILKRSHDESNLTTPSSEFSEESKKNQVIIERLEKPISFYNNIEKIAENIPFYQSKQQSSDSLSNPEEEDKKVSLENNAIESDSSHNNTLSKASPKSSIVSIDSPPPAVPLLQAKDELTLNIEGNKKTLSFSEKVSSSPIGQETIGNSVKNFVQKSENSKSSFDLATRIQALQQLKMALKDSLQNNESHLKLTLHPEELGSIEIKLDIDDIGNVKALFHASHKETMEIIAGRTQDLLQIFRDSKLSADPTSFTFTFSQNQGGFQQNTHNPFSQETYVPPEYQNKQEEQSNSQTQYISSQRSIDIQV
jgi:hypothetical protein